MPLAWRQLSDAPMIPQIAFRSPLPHVIASQEASEPAYFVDVFDQFFKKNRVAIGETSGGIGILPGTARCARSRNPITNLDNIFLSENYDIQDRFESMWFGEVFFINDSDNRKYNG